MYIESKKNQMLETLSMAEICFLVIKNKRHYVAVSKREQAITNHR